MRVLKDFKVSFLRQKVNFKEMRKNSGTSVLELYLLQRFIKVSVLFLLLTFLFFSLDFPSFSKSTPLQ